MRRRPRQLPKPLTGPTDELAQLRSRVAARPADALAAAQLAAALVDDDERTAAVAHAVSLIRKSSALGADANAHEAAVWLTRALDDIDLALLAAETAVGVGDISDGTARLDALIAQHPAHPGARARRAALALGTGDIALALATAEPVATASVEARAAYLQALLAAGRCAEARDFGTSATQAHPDEAVLFDLLGAAYLEAGDHDSAISTFSEALRLAPDRPVAHHNLAVGLANGGSPRAAIGVCDAGLERAPGDPLLTGLRQRLLDAVRAPD